MNKFLPLVLVCSLALSACSAMELLPLGPTAAPPVDLAGTAEVFVQSTLQAQPSPTLAPSNTPVITTPSRTAIPPTPTETQNSALLTLTATLATLPVTTTGTLTTPTGTAPINPSISATSTETLHPRFYGTLPPNIPYGRAELRNQSKAEAYISLQCTTVDGGTTIIEYPVNRTMSVRIPAGRYFYVAWVGGNKMTGSFGLGRGDEVIITLFKDKVVISQ